MSKHPILKVAVNVPLSREFDYQAPARGPVPTPGQRVLIPFGRRQQVGIVTGHAAASEIPAAKLKSCVAVLDRVALLSETDLWLIRFVSDYYHHPIGEVVAAALPAPLRQGKPLHPVIEKIAATGLGSSFDLPALDKRAPKQAELLQALLDAGDDGLEAELATEMLPHWRRAARGLAGKGLIRFFETRAADFVDALAADRVPGPELNPEQQSALLALRSSDHYGVYLLDGVTGSGKTEVYLQRVDDVLRAGKQALLLVPEIGLTPQLVTRLRDRLGIEPALLHSGLSDSARLAAWRAARSGAATAGHRHTLRRFHPARTSGTDRGRRGTRSLLQQQEGLRYSARDLAIARAKPSTSRSFSARPRRRSNRCSTVATMLTRHRCCRHVPVVPAT